MSALFSTPKTPDLPPPPAPPTRDDAADKQAAADEERRKRAAAGRASTVLTSDATLGPENIGKKELLG
jgi:hypothetical protein